MLVLVVTAVISLAVGGVVGGIALVWPRADPAAPSGASAPSAVAGRPDELAEAEHVLRPRGTTILGLSAAAVAVALSGLAFGLLFLLVRSRTGFSSVDLGPTRWAARNATDSSSEVLRLLTHLGSSSLAVPLVVAVAFLEMRRAPNRSIPYFLLLVEGGQLLIANVIKGFVDRARPDISQLVGVSATAFPSGHATTAAATFAAIALLFGRNRSVRVRAALAAGAAGLAALVACTRVMLGVHWVTDVLAGAALGWGWAALCSMAFGGRLLRFGAPVEQGMAAAAGRGSGGTGFSRPEDG